MIFTYFRIVTEQIRAGRPTRTIVYDVSFSCNLTNDSDGERFKALDRFPSPGPSRRSGARADAAVGTSSSGFGSPPPRVSSPGCAGLLLFAARRPAQSTLPSSNPTRRWCPNARAERPPPKGRGNPGQWFPSRVGTVDTPLMRTRFNSAPLHFSVG